MNVNDIAVIKDRGGHGYGVLRGQYGTRDFPLSLTEKGSATLFERTEGR